MLKGKTILLGVTGGFLWGFLAMGLTYRVLSRFGNLPALITGLLVCYGCGCLWFSVYAGGAGFVGAVVKCVVPYLIPDAAKIWLAYSLSRRLQRLIT